MGGTGKDRTLRRLGAQASLPRESPTPEVSRDPVWQPDPAWPFLAQTSEQVPAPTSKGSRLTSAFSQLADQSASSLTAGPVWECGMQECGELRVSLASALSLRIRIREPVPAPTDAASSWPRCPVSPLENPATAGTEDCPPALPRLTSVVSNTLEEACRAGGTPGFTSRQPRPALGDPSLCPLSTTRHQGFSPPGSA